MVAWVNRAVYQLPRNGTTNHTIDPTSAVGLVSGAAFTPTVGRLLLVVIEGAVTSSTPAGWTLPAGGSAVNNTGLYVWHRTAVAGSNAATTTHNGGNYPVVTAVYEFPAGSSFVKSVAATGVTAGGANPNLTGLTGTNTVMAVKAVGVIAGDGTAGVSWSAGVEDWDVVAWATTTDGYVASLASIESHTAASWQPAGTVSGTNATAEALTFAVKLPAGGGAFAVSGTVTSVSNVTGAVTSRLAASGAVVSGSSAVGTVTVSAPVQGIVGSVSTISGAVTAIIPTSGAVESSSTVAGQVTKISFVSGVVSSTSAVMGTLDGAGSISGTITSTSSVHGSVTVAYPVSGMVASASHVTGILDIKGGLSGVVTSTSDVFGAVTVTMQLSGMVGSSSVVQGAVRKDEPETGPLTLTVTLHTLTITGHAPALTLTATIPELTMTGTAPALTLEAE